MIFDGYLEEYVLLSKKKNNKTDTSSYGLLSNCEGKTAGFWPILLILHAYGLGHSQGPYMPKSFVVK